MNLLIVDDEKIYSTILSDLLSPYYGLIVCAQSMAEAFKLAGTADVIILDLSLPDSAASQTMGCIPTLKALPRNPYVIVLSGWVEDIAKELRISGADEIIPKSEAFVKGVTVVKQLSGAGRRKLTEFK